MEMNKIYIEILGKKTEVSQYLREPDRLEKGPGLPSEPQEQKVTTCTLGKRKIMVRGFLKIRCKRSYFPELGNMILNLK